jgi:hypothetical protein
VWREVRLRLKVRFLPLSLFMCDRYREFPLDRVRLMGSHVCLGFLKCRLGRSSTLCGDLKGSTHGAKETAHLRDIWHDLTVFYRCVELPQKQVVFSQVLVFEISAGMPVGFAS